MDETINKARAIFYDFFAGLFLHDLLQEREALIKTQLESLSTSPLDDEAEKSLARLSHELKEHGIVVIMDEFNDLFALPFSGAVVLPYVSHYKESRLNGDILVDIRQTIKELPVRANSAQFSESEDHLGFLFLVMRYCIEGKKFEETQKEIFKLYILPYVKGFIDDIVSNSKADFYKDIAAILDSFMDFERNYVK